MDVLIFTNKQNGSQVITNKAQKNTGFNDCTGERVFLDETNNYVLTLVVKSRYTWTLGNIRNLIDLNLEYFSDYNYNEVFKTNPNK